MSKKKIDLSKGFLILYDWMPILRLLPGEEFKEALIALIDRQCIGRRLGEFQYSSSETFAKMAEPTIKRRLERSKSPVVEPSAYMKL